MGVLQAAVFRAQSPVCAYCVCLKYLCVVMAGDDIGLTCELRDPETVNDVGRLEGDVYDRVNGDAHFIGGEKKLLMMGKFAPPLASKVLHRQPASPFPYMTKGGHSRNRAA